MSEFYKLLNGHLILTNGRAQLYYYTGIYNVPLPYSHKIKAMSLFYMWPQH